MGSGRTWVLLAALIAVGSAPHRVAAKRPAPDPAALCAARKLAATGGTALADLRCHGKAAAKGRVVEASCVAGPRQRLAGAFGKAERPGSCAATGDAGAVADGLEQRARDLADLLRPFAARSKCAAKQLKALGVAAKKLYRARAKFVVDTDQAKLDGARAAARARVERAFAKAARKGGCVTLDAPTTPGTLTERAAGTAGPLQVRIEAVKRIRIAAAARAEILAKRAAVEAAGFTVADDGSVLTGTPVPASGWLVTLGSGRGRSDIAGIVTLDVPVDAPAEGQTSPRLRRHLRRRPRVPKRAPARGGGAPDDHVRDHEPRPLRDEREPRRRLGAVPRGRDGDESRPCAAPRRVRRRGEPAQPRPDAVPPKITTEFGTYPNPDPAAEQIACLDYDGFIESHTDRGDSSETGVIAYPGSTCNIQVNLGCCDNEAADIGRRFTSAVDPVAVPDHVLQAEPQGPPLPVGHQGRRRHRCEGRDHQGGPDEGVRGRRRRERDHRRAQQRLLRRHARERGLPVERAPPRRAAHRGSARRRRSSTTSSASRTTSRIAP